MNIYPWQRSQWQHLCQAFLNEQLPHAVLLNGQAGLGKFEFAKAFSKFLLCSDSNKRSSLQYCNECKYCNLVDKDSNPDLHTVTLEDSNVIKLEQIKTLILQMNNKAHYDGYKTIIIYPAEKMNVNAANALLKNLEEPVGSSTIFLLVTHQSMQLSATIRSRCQRINFQVPEKVTVKQWLGSQTVIEESDFEAAYQLAQGAPLAVQQYLTDPAAADTKNLMEQMQQLFTKKSILISEQSKLFSKFPVSDFIYCLQIILIDLIKFNAKLNKEKLYYLMDDINQRKKALEAGIQLNAQLVIEDYLIKLKSVAAHELR